MGKDDRKVLVLYTGGTIGMTKIEGALQPKKGVFETMVRGYPQLNDNNLWMKRSNDCGFDRSLLILPESKDSSVRIYYKIIEYENLLDSSNVCEKEWVMIARDVMRYYDEYDGFVVLHGTDTLAYTASALSFMFENLSKGIVLTGAQVPIFEARTDGTDNFVTSLLIAGGLNIPEVTIFFGDKLLRGNRTRKISADHLLAFDSPNYVPLVTVGVDLDVNKRAIFRPNSMKKCYLHSNLEKNVGLLRIFPNISTGVFRAFCQPPIKGVVLESYGSGNIPSNRPDIFEEIDAAVGRGVLFVNITQCATGSVSPLYETGVHLAQHGVVSGFDMTPEAALAKLSYVLSRSKLDYQQKKDILSTNIRGELTNTSSMSVDNEGSTVKDALATSLNIQSPKILDEIAETVFNTLLFYGVEHGDLKCIKKMIAMGADINAQNCEGRTPLHEATMKGNPCLVQYLLNKGANVHIKTKNGEPPIIAAINGNHTEMVSMLIECGGNLGCVCEKSVAELICDAAKNGSIKKLKNLKSAGADFNISTDLKHTPLHMAVLCNCPHTVEYLLEEGAKPETEDLLGHTPLDYALHLGYNDIANLIIKHEASKTESKPD